MTTTENVTNPVNEPPNNGAAPRAVDWENPRVASILSAAAKCFARKGFTATTLAEIGKELGLRKSIVHYYFASKAALIHEVQSYTYHRYLDRVKDAIRRPATPRPRADDGRSACALGRDPEQQDRHRPQHRGLERGTPRPRAQAPGRGVAARCAKARADAVAEVLGDSREDSRRSRRCRRLILAVLNGLSVTEYLEGEDAKAKEAYDQFLYLVQARHQGTEPWGNAEPPRLIRNPSASPAEGRRPRTRPSAAIDLKYRPIRGIVRNRAAESSRTHGWRRAGRDALDFHAAHFQPRRGSGGKARQVEPQGAANAVPVIVLPPPPIGPRAWLSERRYALPKDGLNGLLDRFSRPAREAHPDFGSFFQGRYGTKNYRLGALRWNEPPELETSTDHPEPLAEQPLLALEVDPLELARSAPIPGVETSPLLTLEVRASPEPELSKLSQVKTCPAWQRRRPVTLMRHGAERDTFNLLECDGSVASEALDRLSVLARPPGPPRPELPLPIEPLADGSDGEWVPGVRMLHPRLVWLVERIAQSFPGRALYVISGYRPDDHGSQHQRGRALDLYVMGIPNEELLRVCRTLHDVGCGYYPNNRFVHVDVRPFGTGHPLWIDVAKPGEPSRYVDAWPGLIEAGAVDWLAEG